MLELAHYNITEKLYEGRKSTLFRGTRTQDQTPVILKTTTSKHPPLSEIARLKHEYSILKDHHIKGMIQAFELIEDHARLVLVLEDIGGKPIRDQFNSQDLSVGEFLKMAIRVVEAVGYIHQHHLIHKDLNPYNIIMNPETEQVQLIDFGISSLLSRENPKILSPEYLEGTLSYISPEQTGRMNRAVDYRTDFYSLGVTFYFILTGQLPFDFKDPMELIHAHIAKPPHSVIDLSPDIPEMLSRIVAKLLAKRAEARYQGAYGLKTDLEICQKEWNRSQRIEVFELGRHDISSQFQIPQNLYGRAGEVNLLLQSFDRVSEGITELLLVGGYSGVGKSALVNEVQKPIVRKRGYFVDGKFDQFKRNIPYSSVIQAFANLIQQILTESQERIQQWKEKILPALGRNGQVIIEVIPELEWIIGEQPPVPELSAAEAQNRFRVLFQNFIQVFATAEHPLVIFLDDLQWADVPSLNLIKAMVVEPDIHYLFVIGAYRDNETNSAHPLMLMVSELRKKQHDIHFLPLLPLERSDVHKLVSDTFQCSMERSDGLTEEVHRKTNGNPFFVYAFLKSLYDAKHIEFNLTQGEWQWDLEQIHQADMSDNVVDLMVRKIKTLSQTTQYVLKLAACVGNHFDLKTLSIVYEKSLHETAQDFWEAVKEGLIVPIGQDYKLVHITEGLEVSEDSNASYRFLHDRVQQAAYALISDEHKQWLNLQIGRLMLRSVKAEELDDVLFEIVNHFNIGMALINNTQETENTALLNYQAGRKAKSSAAYGPAVEYLSNGLKLLPDNWWDTHYDLAFPMSRELVECEYLNGQFEISEEHIKELLTHTKTTLDTVEVYRLLMVCYASQSRYRENIEIGLKALALCGQELPLNPGEELVGAEFGNAAQNLGDRSVDTLIDLPDMDDPIRKSAMRLLVEIWSPNYIEGNDTLLALGTVRMVNLSMQHGNTAESIFGYVSYGLLLTVGLGQVELGYQFGTLAITLSEKLHDMSFRAKTHHIFGGLTSHWRVHLKNSHFHALSAYEYGLQTGDLIWGNYGIVHVPCQAFVRGMSLEHLQTEYDKFYPSVMKMDDPIPNLFFKLFYFGARGLRDRKYDFTDGDVIDENRDLENDHIFNLYQTIKSQLLYFYGQYEGGFECAKEAKRTVHASVGNPVLVDQALYQAMNAAALYVEADETRKIELLQHLEEGLEKLKAWSENCPENMLHKRLLVEGEHARITGDLMAALRSYHHAAESAEREGFQQVQALGYELTAKLYQSQEIEEMAKAYMQKAHYHYTRWGARVKVTDLENTYPQWFRTIITNEVEIRETVTPSLSISSGNMSQALDVHSVIKTSQAISQEIVLDNLVKKILQIVVENAGAQRGILLLKKEDTLVVEAVTSVNDEEVTLESLPMEDYEEIAHSIVHFVEHTGKHAVIQDAQQDGRFASDPYVLEQKPKSILGVPLIYQTKFLGVLYLEHSLLTGAFTPARLEVLNLLLAQITSSLENAILYAAQGEKVRMEAELETAAAVQHALFPSELPQFDNFELGSFFQSATETGGDWYGFMQPTPEYFYILIGDATGHGTPSALVTASASATCQTIERFHASLKSAPSPATILEYLNATVFRTGQLKFGMSFFVARLNINTGDLLFANAGHNYPIWIQDGFKPRRLLVSGSILGYHPSPNFQERTIQLSVRDKLFFFTDGLIENSNSKGNIWGERRLPFMVQQHEHNPAQAWVDAVVADAYKFFEGHPLEDDMTVVSCQITKPFPKANKI